MSGVSIKVDGSEAALEALGAMIARAKNTRGLFDEIGASLVVSTQRRFEDGRAPDGSPWPPSFRALAEGGKTLVDTARLMQSITHVASDGGVEVGTNVLYAATHQLGATIRPVNAKALAFKIGGREIFAQEVTIPARPFLGLDDDDETEILAIAGDWIGAGEAEASP